LRSVAWAIDRQAWDELVVAFIGSDWANRFRT